jgi:hypothetical protein
MRHWTPTSDLRLCLAMLEHKPVGPSSEPKPPGGVSPENPDRFT